MTQTIKPNDLVYIPSKTNTLQKVIRDSNNNLAIDDGYYRYIINEQGCRYDFDLGSWGTQPFAFLATPKMKEKLEQVYSELEDIPVDEEVEEFKAMLDIVLYEVEIGSSNKEKYFDDLVQLFKERGSK